MIPNWQEHRIPVIYRITNRVNGKIYVGSAINLVQRYMTYRSNAQPGRRPRRYMDAAMLKYGFYSFDFDILERVTDVSSILQREQYWMDLLRPFDKAIGYNVNPKADSWLGRHHSEETKRKVSEAKRGKKLNLSAQQRENKRETSRRHSVDRPRFCKRPVVQVDCESKAVIATHESIQVASDKTGIDRGLIGAAANAKSESAYGGGFLWCFQRDYGVRQLSRKRRISFQKVISRIPVQQVCAVGATVWPSIREACRWLKLDRKSVYRAAVSKQECGGSQWLCDLTDRAYED